MILGRIWSKISVGVLSSLLMIYSAWGSAFFAFSARSCFCTYVFFTLHDKGPDVNVLTTKAVGNLKTPRDY